MSPTFRVLLPLLAASAWLSAPVANAHVMSASQGTLQLNGNEVRYELRMPLYEIADIDSPESTLLEAFRVRSESGEPIVSTGSCAEDPAQELYVCQASFTFAQPPRSVRVSCEYASVIVSNHVHILRSGEGESARQTIFDIASPEAEIRFAAPVASEIFRSQFEAGARRVILHPILALFLFALTLSARTPREAQKIVAAFVAVEVSAALVFQAVALPAPARFVEAAGALTIAYLAVEILLLPNAGKRWLIAGGMGLFHGLLFGGFLRQAELQPLYFLSGVVLCELILLAILGAIRRQIRSRRSEQLAALLLLVIGLGWFLIRLLG